MGPPTKFTQFLSTEPWRKVVLEHALDAVIAMDDSNVIIDWNLQAETVFGWKKEEVLGKALADIVIPIEYRAPHQQGLDRFLATGEGPILNQRIEVFAIRKSGDKFPVELTVIPLKLEDKFIFYSFLRDISVRKSLEEEKDKLLQEETKSRAEAEKANSRLKSILDQSIIGIAQTDLHGHFLEANEFYCNLVGRSREELLELNMVEITHPDDREGNLKLFKGLLDSGEGFTIEKRYVRPDGSFVWVNNSISLISDKKGKPHFITALSKDITAQKEAEASRERLNTRIKLLAEVSSVLLENPLHLQERVEKFAELIIPRIADWCIVDLLNESGELDQLAVTHRDPLLAGQVRKLRELYPPDPNAEAGSFYVLKSGKPQLIPKVPPDLLKRMARDERHLELLNELKLFSYLAVPIRGHGNLFGVLSLVNESTSFTEEDVRFAEELASRAAFAIHNARLFNTSQEAVRARDEFLSIASHELKTPVTSLKLQTQLFQKKLEHSDFADMQKDSEKLINVYERNIERMSRLIEDMLDIARITHGKLQLEFTSQRVGKLIESTVERLDEELKKANIKLTVHLADDPLIDCDVFRIEQVLSNLVTNACKYASNSALDIRSYEEGKFAIIKIQDCGPGIEEEDLKRIFTRFERAISVNISGLGLGLYISREIVEAHGGEIWAESAPGKGSSFFIKLPKA